MFSVYKSYHQMVKYGKQRNHVLQDLRKGQYMSWFIY